MPAENNLDEAFESFVLGFDQVFSNPQLAHFRIYLLGLLLCLGTPWIRRIQQHVGHNRSYSSFVNFISDSPWSSEEAEIVWQGYLNHHARRVLAALKRKAKGKKIPIYLIIDDTINPKRGKKMAWAGRHYSHSHGQVINGHCLVSAQLVVGNLSIPIAFALYRKKIDCEEANVPFFSKIELASQIVRLFQAPAGTKVYVLVDSWYGANKFFKLVVKEKKFHIIAAIKRNRKLYYASGKKKAKEYAKGLEDEDFDLETIESRLYHFHLLKASLSSGTKGLVLISRSIIGSKECTCFIFCSDRSLTAKEIAEKYRIRWEIETFYKNAKQLLGLSDYQVISQQAIHRHFLFVFMIASFLYVQSQLHHEELLSENPLATKPTIGELKRLYCKKARRLFIQTVIGMVRRGFSSEHIYKRLYA